MPLLALDASATYATGVRCGTEFPSDGLCRIDANWTASQELYIANLGNSRSIFFGTVKRCTAKTFPNVKFRRYPTVRKARVNCRIESISARELERAGSLTELSLNGNSIRYIRGRTFRHLNQLTILDLSRNSITDLENFAFSGMHQLEDLNLRNNSLTSLKRSTFSGVPKLKSISLAYNQISSIEAGTFDWPFSNLSTLDLLQNRLVTLDKNIFAGAPNLRVVRLPSNLITTIEEGAFDLPKVVRILLGRNPLSTLPDKLFANAPNLRELFLEETAFKKFPSALFDPSVAVTDLVFSNNLDCEVSVRDIARVPQLRVVDLLHVTYESPGMPFDENKSKIVKLRLNARNLPNDILDDLSHLHNLEQLEIGTVGVISPVYGIERVKAVFPNMKKVTLRDYGYECEWVHSLASRLKTVEVELVAPYCPSPESIKSLVK